MDIEKDGNVATDTVRTTRTFVVIILLMLMVHLFKFFVIYYQKHGCWTQLCDYKVALFGIFVNVVFIVCIIYGFLIVVRQKYNTHRLRYALLMTLVACSLLISLTALDAIIIYYVDKVIRSYIHK
jgi:hypothetical protein